MNLQKPYKYLSILSMIFGSIILLTIPAQIQGFAVVNNTLTTNSSIIWGSFFLLTGLALLHSTRK